MHFLFRVGTLADKPIFYIVEEGRVWKRKWRIGHMSVEGLLEIVVEIDSLRTLRAYKPLENLHAPAPPGVWVLQSDDGPSGTRPSISVPSTV